MDDTPTRFDALIASAEAYALGYHFGAFLMRLRDWRNARDKAKVEFAEAFDNHPMQALEWANGTIETFARGEVADQLIAAINGRDPEEYPAATLAEHFAPFVIYEALTKASSDGRSTSPTMNATARYTAAAWARLADDLHGPAYHAACTASEQRRLAKLKPDIPADYVPHDGGPRPKGLRIGTVVSAITRGGKTVEAKASKLRWEWTPQRLAEGDILAYRVVL